MLPLPATPTNADLQARLIDDLAPALTSQFGIDARIAAGVTNWLRSLPDLIACIDAGQSFVVVAPESFVPQLLDRVRARLAMHSVMVRVHAAGHDPGTVALVSLAPPLLMLREARAQIRAEVQRQAELN